MADRIDFPSALINKIAPLGTDIPKEMKAGLLLGSLGDDEEFEIATAVLKTQATIT